MIKTRLSHHRLPLQRRLPLLLVPLLLWTNNHVRGLSTGAAACPAGIAAVSGQHLLSTNAITTGSLADGGFRVSLLRLHDNDDEVVLSSSDASAFSMGKDYALTLSSSSSDKRFRGFLVRLGPNDDDDETTANAAVVDDSNNNSTTTAVTTRSMVDTTYALNVLETDGGSSGSGDVQIAEFVCVVNENVGGLTHTNANDKASVSGLLRIDPDENDPATNALALDVTVVVQNQNSISEYYYDRFVLNAIVVREGDVEDDGSGSNGDGGDEGTPSDSNAQSSHAVSSNVGGIIAVSLVLSGAMVMML